MLEQYVDRPSGEPARLGAVKAAAKLVATANPRLQQDVTLSIRVQPRSSRNAIVGWTGDVLKMKLTAPPVEGEANEACLVFLAKLLDLAPSGLALIQGARSRTKLIRITGLTQDEVHARLLRK